MQTGDKLKWRLWLPLAFGMASFIPVISSGTIWDSGGDKFLFALLHRILNLGFHEGCELLVLFDNYHHPLDIHNMGVDLFQANLQTSGQRVLYMYASNVTYPRHKDIHRFTQFHCAIGALNFNKFTSPEKLQSWLFSTLIPRYGPVLRKDEDHFIFLSPSKDIAEEVLLSNKFGEKIKYKLALFIEDENAVACETVDFYANIEGGPLIRTISTELINPNTERSDAFPDMTVDFNGHLFRITVPNVKYRFEMEWRDGAYHPKRGFYKWWLDEAILKFNFTYVMFWSSFEKATGKPLENGTWVGAAGDLLYDKADIAVIVGETYSRQPFFGFSSVLSYEWFFFKTHTPWKTYSPKAIFWPFSPLVWFLFFVSLILMTFSLKAITQFSTDPKSRSTKWTYSRMFDYIFTTFMEQDRDGPLNTSSIRMLCAFWLLFAMVTSTAYRGGLVTLIAFPVDSWIPSTFEELANSHFKVALNNVGKVGAAYDMLSSSTNPIFQKLFHKMEMIGQPEICLTRAMTEDMGCIIWEGITQYANARNVSDRYGFVPMVQSKEIALFIGDGFTYERRAIFKHHMDRTIEAALQMGLTIKWLDMDKEFIWRERKKWEVANNKTEVYYDRDEGPQKLILSQFAGLYLIYAGGLCAATIAFVKEKKVVRFNATLQQPKVDTTQGLPETTIVQIEVAEREPQQTAQEKYNFSPNSAKNASEAAE